MLILAVNVVVACQSGEVVKARWTDGTWMKATIIEVRDKPNGVCGQYRVVWHHNDICEDPTITGHDTRVSMTFCLVSRDYIQGCKQELCRSGNLVKSQSSGAGESEDSNRHVTVVLSIVFVLLFCCCACRSLQQRYASHENDEEKGMGAGTPSTGRSLKSGRSFWNLSPKSATSSPMAKWINKARRAPGPARDGKKIVTQSAPIASVPPAKNQNGNFQVAEKKHVHSAKGTGANKPFCPPDMLQTHSSALRQTSWTCGGQPVPPLQSKSSLPQLPTLLQHGEGPINPPPQKKSLRQGVPPPQGKPPQLSILLQHRESLSKPPPRKKPPLQGVPPQGKVSERAKAGSSSYKARSQAPYFV